MINYLIRRLLLIIPTLFGIMLINFMILQFLPGGPIEQFMAEIRLGNIDSTFGLTGSSGETLELNSNDTNSDELFADATARAGLDDRLVESLKIRYGLDKSASERFIIMMKNYLIFDFGDSFFRGRSVVDLIIDKMPVSISLGLWTTLIVYLISIPLGIMKAVRHGSKFDVNSSLIIIIGNAIPSFLFAIMLIIFFAGGKFVDWFPLRGLTSDNFAELSWYQKIIDYMWHLTLPLIAMTIGGFAGLTLLTKNSFLEHIHSQYVITARAKGASPKRILFFHVFRNAMLIIIAGFPSALIGIFFTSSLLIEIIFSLDGLGLLGYEAVLARDYPIVMGTLYFFTLLGLLIGIISDFTYTLIDPRIDFESRKN